MKIGILTYHRSHNYGALLQAYALKTYLESFGHNVEFVDYWPEYHRSNYTLIPNYKNLSFTNRFKSILKLCLGFRKTLERRAGYFHFMDKCLNLTSSVKYTDSEQMSDLKYDTLICGSDQIWRKQNFQLFKGFNGVYFGQGIHVNRLISYAASMGVLVKDTESINTFGQLLGNFDAISVRESQLQSLVQDTITVLPQVVLDPVFLLKPKQWQDLCQVDKVINEPYILFYHLTISDEALHKVEQLRAKTGLRVIEIQGRYNTLKRGNRFAYQTASPEDFINLIMHAEYVVSTSFHGVAFAIIFQRPFLALGMGNNSDRVNSLLAMLKISNPLNIDDLNKQYSDFSINNYNDIVEESRTFLVDNIDD